MTALVWGELDKRIYETGVDKGVLYDESMVAVWPGLISVTESEVDARLSEVVFDSLKIYNTKQSGSFQCLVEAFGIPDDFRHILGETALRPGFRITGQPRASFGFSFQSMISDAAFKLHLVYNCVVVPTKKGSKTLNQTTQPTNFTWKMSAIPVDSPSPDRSPHLVFDSRKTPTGVMLQLTDILYGTDESEPRLPSQTEIASLYSHGVIH